MLELLGFAGSLATALEKAYADKLAATTNEQRIAADTVIADIKERQASAREAMKHWYTYFWIFVFQGIVTCYAFQVVVFNTMWGWGSTPAVHGMVGDWMGSAIYSMFGFCAVSAIANKLSR